MIKLTMSVGLSRGIPSVATRTANILSTFFSTSSNNLTDSKSASHNTVEDPLQFNPKDNILSDVSNRNPRNMEMLRIARKPKGYDLDAIPPNYWYRLEHKQAGRHTIGTVRHYSGAVVVRASTAEWPLQSRLPSTADYTAVVTLARVLARRCLEAGITEMAAEKFFEKPKSANLDAFLQTMLASGVQLHEPFQLHEFDHYPWAMEQPTSPWEVPEHVALNYAPPRVGEGQTEPKVEAKNKAKSSKKKSL